MIKKNIKYTDFNGSEQSEDFYFHLSLPEVTRIEAELGKSLEEHSAALAESKDLNEMIKFVEKLILNSYGKKTLDGRSFQKSEELRKEFEYSPAYAELFEELLTNHEAARKFGEGIVDNGKARKNTVAPKVTQ